MRLFTLITFCTFIAFFQNAFGQDGTIKVKFTEEFVEKIETSRPRLNKQGVVEFGIRSFDSLNSFYQIQALERVFPYSPKFEKRHRKHGLHLWYKLRPKGRANTVQACVTAYNNCSYIVRAEAPLEKKFYDGYEVGADDKGVLAETNDPLFSQQWHYENTGQSGGTAGADIDLKSAWDIQQGDPDVVVAIIDGGLDIAHEDLADNIWVNTAELDGDAGVDDDGNGYIDDIHGYGFGDGTGNFTPHYHGVHVGGTVAAVNNNDIGVSGIAGGSGAGDGVKMMSCAVFGAFSANGFDAAFVYAADNGAVIAQNSWGYTSAGVYEQSVLDAIDYFIANAGYDENGDPVGPMQGGIVIFAAGNDNSSANYYPGYYDSVVAVASTDHNDVRSSFSNYGDWVEIAAPGSNVFSTYLDNSYNYMSGTSMACPHVSGVAALIVSEFGETGFAPEQVWGRLVGTTDNIDAQNPSYIGLLGTGRLNAFNSLQTDDGIPPDPITDLAVAETGAVAVTLNWTATGASGAEGRCSLYDIRYATFEITGDNFDAANQVNDAPPPKVAGASEEFEVTGLDPVTTYYFAVKASNFFGSESGMSNVVQTTTSDVPEIVVAPDSLVAIVDPGESAELTFTISNTGNEVLNFSIPGYEVSPAVASGKTDPEPAPAQISVSKGMTDPRIGDVVLSGQGDDGPDGFGYRWVDSNEPGGPAFAWEDISASGVNITGAMSDDNVSGPYPLGFDFDFYENTYAEFYVSSNGFIRFGTAGSSGCCSGQPIPAADGIDNIIAWAWRDGYPTGNVYYENFDDKTVIQFQDYGLFGGGGTATAEIIIYSNGSVKLNYLSLLGAYNDGRQTVGIENEDGTDGLQIAFNTTYLEESLSIYISTGPAFIEEVTPTDGSLATGESVEVTVTVNTQDLEAGNYEENLAISSNDPVTPEAQVYVLMHINGVPEIDVASQALDFGEVFVGIADTLDLMINNVGTDTLVVDSIVFNSESPFSLANSSFPIAIEAGHTSPVNVVFEAFTLDSFAASMSVYSNDLDNSPLEIDLQANSVDAPVIVASPDRFDEALNTGETATQTLSIDNSAGGSGLFWDLDVRYSEEVLSYERDKSNDMIRTDLDATEFVDAPSKSNSMASPSSVESIPFRDGFESGNYDGWVEGSGAGVREVTNATSAVGSYSFHYQSSNNNQHLEGIHQNFEAGGQPENISFYVRSGSQSLADGYFLLRQGGNDAIWFYASTTGRFYVNGDVGGDESFAYNENEWYHIAFQDIDWEDKDFDYYVNDELIKADISFRNSWVIEQFDALYLYNFHASDAWWDDINVGEPPFNWLRPETIADTVLAGAAESVAIEFDAEGLNGGTYEATLQLASNDPLNGLLTIPVALEVTGAPDITSNVGTLDFGVQFLDVVATDSILITNSGTDSLGVTGITINNDRFAVDTTAFGLEPNQSLSLAVTYSPIIQGPENALMQILSNDPDEGVFSITLMGEGIVAPVIVASPDRFDEALNTGETATQTLSIDNSAGGSGLFWDLDVRYSAEVLSHERDKSNDVIRTDLDATEFVDAPSKSNSMASPSSVESIPFRDGFESGNYDGWVEGSGAGVREVTNATSAVGSYSFHYQSSNSRQHLEGIHQNFEAGGQPENISFYVRSGSQSLADGYFLLRQGGNDAIWFFASTTGRFYVNGDVGGDESFAYNENEWYHIAFQDIDWEDKDFDYYVNDELIKADISFRNSWVIEQFDALYLYNFHASDAWWDDINIGEPPFNWLRPETIADTVLAGAAESIAIEFDAEGLNGGTYEASLHMASNDPVNSLITIPVTLEVTGAPDITSNVDTLDFGVQFLDVVATDSILITNSGVASLGVTSIMIDNDSYAVDTTSFGLEPNQTLTLQVTYTPSVDGTENAFMRILSNDPDEATLTIPLMGQGAFPPSIAVSLDSIAESLPVGDSDLQWLQIANEGEGSELLWEIDLAYNERPLAVVPVAESRKVQNNAGLWVGDGISRPYPQAPGDFYDLPASPANLTCMAIDPSNAMIYAQGNYSYNFYQYNVETAVWSELAPAPIYSGNNGGATFLDGKIYTTYTSNSTLGIYDIATNTWETQSLPISTGNITTDGEYLYLVGSTLYRYDVVLNESVELSSPIIAFEPWGGLEYFDGYLYGHVGNGLTGFQRYDIANDSWEELARVPSGAVLGAAIDPVARRYHTYGNYEGTSWYSYDIDNNEWSITTIPFFNVRDGGLVYQGRGEAPGIYFIQGESGPGFARFETEPEYDWLTLDVYVGSIGAGGEQAITVRFDASGLETGLYLANLNISSNDPLRATLVVPVSLSVPGPSAPIIENHHFEVPENMSHRHEIGGMEAHDPDGDMLMFHIETGNTTGAFTMSPQGMLMVNDSAQFDFEAANLHELTVSASDGLQSAHATVTVEVSDVNEAPSIENQAFLVDGNVVEGHLIGQLVASDPENDMLTFQIETGNTGEAFALTQEGLLTVNDSAQFDFEAVNMHELTVSVSDGVHGDLATVTVQVIAAGTPNIENQSFRVNENVAEGHLIGQIVATDPENDMLTFQIETGNTGEAFALTQEGMLTVNDSAQFDFEAVNMHELIVSVSDGVLSDLDTVTVQVSNVEEAPHMENQAFMVNENMAEGHLIGQIVATDPENDMLTFQIEAGNTGEAFALSSQGMLTVNDSAQFDFEAVDIHELIVSVSDGALSDLDTVSVQVSNVEEAPHMEKQAFMVNENVAEGHLVGQIVATDPENDMLTFQIVTGNTTEAFTLTTQGMLMVNDSAQFDFEAVNMHELIVSVSDGVLSDLDTVSVQVSDVNEAPNIENQAFDLDENVAEGHLIGQIVAVDIEQNALSYSILQGNESGAFDLTNVGALSVNDSAQFDYEINPNFVLEVQVDDGAMVSTARVEIALSNLPEIADQTFSVEENVPIGHLIGVLDAGVEDMNLLYEITSGNQNQTFAIDNEGKLTVLDSAAIDFEKDEEHYLQVQVTDGRVISQADVTVVVTDIDDLITGLEELVGQVNIFPNPAAHYLTIQSASMIKRVKVVDATGKSVAVFNLNKMSETLDVAYLTKGSYYLIIETKDSTNIERFIKQ
jgi:subtilisin family serine protease